MSVLAYEGLSLAVLPPVGATCGNRQEDPIAQRVEQALAIATPDRHGVERRRLMRWLYPYPVYLTPIDDGEVPEPIVVIGKHLSPQGLDFYHREPVPYRRVIASLDGGEQGWIGLLLELAWCRFSRHGWYDNGGRFLGVVESPMNG